MILPATDTQCPVPLNHPDHPFLRGVDPSEPFDILAYAFKIGQLAARSRALELDRAAVVATRSLTAFYRGRSYTPPPPPPVPQLNEGDPIGVCGEVYRFLKANPYSAVAVMKKKLAFDPFPHLMYLKKTGRAQRNGKLRTATWHAL